MAKTGKVETKLRFSPSVGNTLTCIMNDSDIGRLQENKAQKDTGFGWLSLSCIDTLQRENEKLRAVCEQLKPKYESRKASLGI